MYKQTKTRENLFLTTCENIGSNQAIANVIAYTYIALFLLI